MWQPLLGLVVICLLCWALSESRKNISLKLLGSGILLQLVVALILLKAPVVQPLLLKLNALVLALDTATKEGTQFVFGYLGGGPLPFETKVGANTMVLAFQILPLIVVLSAISAWLFYIGLLQKLVGLFSLVLEKTLKISGASSLGVAANIFLGMIEAPVFVRPYLKAMSRSELFLLMCAGMSTVAGTVMLLYAKLLDGVVENPVGHILTASLISAPAAVVIAHLLVPPTEQKKTTAKKGELKSEDKSSFDAIVRGANEGLQMVLGITAILIVLFAFVSLINQGLGLLPSYQNNPITLQFLAGWVFAPFCWLMGIPWAESFSAGQLMGIKTVLNEFVGYMSMGSFKDISADSKLILTYAMCGFANFGSLGILIGGFSSMIPERKKEVAALGLKSILAGTMATMMTGCLIGVLTKI